MTIINRTWLPDEITHRGQLYKKDLALSSYLDEGKPALLPKGCIQVNVLQKELRGVLNLHNKPYQPSKFIFKRDEATRQQLIEAAKIWMVYPDKELDNVLYEGTRTLCLKYLKDKGLMSSYKAGKTRLGKLIWEVWDK